MTWQGLIDWLTKQNYYPAGIMLAIKKKTKKIHWFIVVLPMHIFGGL